MRLSANIVSAHIQNLWDEVESLDDEVGEIQDELDAIDIDLDLLQAEKAEDDEVVKLA